MDAGRQAGGQAGQQDAANARKTQRYCRWLDAGPKGDSSSWPPSPPNARQQPRDRGSEMGHLRLSPVACLLQLRRFCLCALTILWRAWKRGVPVPIDFEPETTAQQRSPSSYAGSSKVSDCQAASLARSGGREHPTRRDCLPSRLLFALRGAYRGHRC
ncbi:hypothetical protein A7C99_1993 [Trichophyton rubrum]|uniref:Uncharacterized protein n=1 Tax=Trichophyton rubrum TaxID=5551 RepID=A0A178F3M5_TRIRU|nr:hypothetical protein A7C99_1993 [Trichophyton rubrum]